MNEEKKVPFKWNMGKKPYRCNLGCMRIISGLYRHDYPYRRWSRTVCRYDGEPTGYSLDPGEAFISGDITRTCCIHQREQIGEGASLSGAVRYGKYSAVAFIWRS